MRNKKHRVFIGCLPCATCLALPPSQCSHDRRNTEGGTALKPNDKWTFPQCYKCHLKVDFLITDEKIDIFKKLCLDLYEVSGNIDKGFSIIQKFRRDNEVYNQRR